MNTNHTKNLLLLLLVVVGILPTQLFVTAFSENNSSLNAAINPLRGDTKYINIPRLGSVNSEETRVSNDISSNELLTNQTRPNFAIGSQEGTGGGTYNVYDSFNWTGNEIIDTQNGIDIVDLTPTIREDTLTITNPSNYIQQFKYFNLTDIQSVDDWRLIEAYFSGVTFAKNSRINPPDAANEGMWLTIAISFEIKEANVNLSSVQTYTKNGGSGSPTGDVWIEGESAGSPNGTVLSSIESLKLGNGWNDYTFDNEITLPIGTYYVIMNDTDLTPERYWEWYITKDDQADGSNNSVYALNSYGGSWWEADEFGVKFDSPLQIQIKPVMYDGSNWINQQYNLNDDVKIWYNSTVGEVLLDDTDWFLANTTNTHNFISNTSVTFNLNFIANYTYYSDPIPGSPTYSISNNSIVDWNLTFSTAAINTTYDVNNHVIRIIGIESDWNGTGIIWNNSITAEYSDLDNDVNVTLDGDPTNKYTNGSTVMYINASTLAENTTWNVWFKAPNYIYDFNISLGGSPLTLPYTIYNMYDYSLDFQVGTLGNLTYWIDYPDGSPVIKKFNVDPTQTTISDVWEVNNTLDQNTNINGTYQLQAFWNNSDSTKVGTFTRSVVMYINTSFSSSAETEVIIGDTFNVSAHYQSVHNITDVQNAPIFCDANWTTDVYMNQLGDGSYNASFVTSGRTAGEVGTIDLTTQMGWFVNWTDQITVRFVEQSYLNVNTTPTLSLEWRENATIKINYTDTLANGISGATISVDGDASSAYWDGIDEVYLFRFNSTKYNGIGAYNSLSVTALHSDYLNQEWVFDLVITEGITNITARVNTQSITNDTTVYSIAYANSALDQISINLQYYHILSGLNLTTVQTTVESPFPVTTSGEIADLSYNAVLNPDQTGNFLVNFTFSLANYSSTLFVIHITIDEAITKLETSFTNGTNVIYEEFHEFALIFNNTDYNEKINFNGNDTILINASQYLTWMNRTADLYWFQFSYIPLGIGSYAIIITFQHEYYTDASILLIFNVIPGPTTITGADVFDGSSIINNTINFTRNFSPNDYDSFAISLNYSSLVTTQAIPLGSNNITLEVDGSIYINYYVDGLNNWTFTFNGSLLGSYIINITFSHFNYTSSTFTLFYTIVPANSDITSSSPNLSSGTVNATVKSGNLWPFFLVWESDYGEYLNDTTGVISNDSSVTFTSSISINGTHYFLLTAGNIGTITVRLDFSTENYSLISIFLRFEITDRALDVDDSTSTHPDGFTYTFLQYGDTYYFIVTIVDLDSQVPVNASVSVNPSVNITYMNESNGRHLFQFDAWQIGSTGSLTIQFTKANYEFTEYIITFVIDEASSQVVSLPGSLSLYLSQSLNTSMVWQSIPNPLVNTSPTLKINSSYISILSPLVLFDNVNNGNYSFIILGSTIGDYDIEITFGSLEFENITIIIHVSILGIPTTFGVNTLPANGSLIGDPSPLYYSDNYLLFIEWQNQLNSSGIQDTVPDITGSGREFLIFVTSFINGTHAFIINTTGIGLYDAQITFGTSNYQSILYSITFNISLMPTKALTSDNVSIPSIIYVEETFNLAGTGYQNYRGENVSSIDSFNLWFNNSIMSSGQIEVINASSVFQIAINTEGYVYGTYNVSLRINSTGYQSQMINLTIILLGRELKVDITLPAQTIQQGEDIVIRVTLDYLTIAVGIGASTSLAPLSNINVHYYIEIKFQNGTSSIIEADVETDILGKASYVVEGSTTKHAVGFNNITVLISSSGSSLPTSYSMSADDLSLFEIAQFLDPLEILIPTLIILLIFTLVISSVYYVNRKRVKRSDVKKFADLSVEKGFEDIKSIRLIIARHQSGLQFYAEKTIAELQADTDALSGMSAAMSSFLEELSESMSSQSDTDEIQTRNKIEVMSREGLHMLIWHGNYSSLIIISESQLPDYFQSRLKLLGQEMEGKFTDELKDFYSSDQIPSTVVKKMVRKYIPLHYFCAFVLNEGVLTLDSIKLNRKENKMLQSIKKIMFKIEGVNYFFSEQIISHLSHDYKRSEAIKFLDRAIKINLLIEAEQDDLLRISRR